MGEKLTLYGDAATKKALIDAASGATNVHLACHGRWLPESPLSSEIVLAGHGRLSLQEILRSQPFENARMVVASGCQTAITEFTRLPDEAIGLPSALLQTGTPTVVGTLWSVDDMSTALVMERFYRYHLSGDGVTGEGPMSPARALRLAQRWLSHATALELHGCFLDKQDRDAERPETSDSGTRSASIADAVGRFELEVPSDCPFASPYHWAPFVLLGA